MSVAVAGPSASVGAPDADTADQAWEDAWPPAWAAAIRAATNPALARPRRREDVDCTDVAFGGAPRWVLRRTGAASKEQPRYVRIGPVEHDAWLALDGSRTVLEIAKEVGRAHGVLALPIVEGFVARLDLLGMVDGAPEDVVYPTLVTTVASRGLAGRMQWVRQTLLLRRIAVSRLGPFIDRSYRLVGRWLYPAPSLVALTLLSIAGVIVMLRLGTPNPASLPRTHFVAGSLLGIATIVLHELAHAWTVRHFGRDVHRAGVFLMYGMPGAFVDTTDMWLAPKRQRLWVTAAGPIANLVAAGGFAVAAVAQPSLRGMWLTAASGNYLFVVANLMPLLKLDGYYLLMDAVGVAELRERGMLFSLTQLVPRWREAWRRGELVPRLVGEERLLALYGTVFTAAMAFLGASSVLVLPTRVERLVRRARAGEISGAPLVVMAVFTAVGLVLFVLNLVASRQQLRLAVRRAGRALARLNPRTLLVAHVGIGLLLAWVLPAVAGRRDGDAGREWQLFSIVIASALCLRAAGVLIRATREVAWRWVFVGAALLAAGVASTVVWDATAPVRVGAAAALVGLGAARRLVVRSLGGLVGGAWLLLAVGAVLAMSGRGTPVRTGICLAAAGLVLARLVWTHPQARPVSVTDRPANEAPDDVRDGRHLSRGVVTIAESMLGRTVDVLGVRSRAELAVAFNARMAGRVDIWFTADGRLTDRVTGPCSERGPRYRTALDALASEIGARLGESFASDALTAAHLDLPDGLERLVGVHVLDRATAGLSEGLREGLRDGVRDGVRDGLRDDARRLTVRHLTELPLQAARRVWGDDVVEPVVAQVNATTPAGAGLWLRGNGRLAIDSASVSVTDANAFLGRVLGALSVRTGSEWTRRAVQTAQDALAWQLREATAGDALLPARWGGRDVPPEPEGVGAVSTTVDVTGSASSAVERSPGTGARRRAVPIDGPGGAAGRAVPSASPAGPHEATVAARRRAVAIDEVAVAPGGAVAVVHTTARALRIPVLVGCLVALLLGAYARMHPPTGQSSWHPFFSRMITFKSWSATAALACALFQVSTGTVVHRRRAPAGASALLGWHRLSGMAAFVLSLPVAFHCLWALGFAPSLGANRVFAHSVAGCLLYGGYATKVLAVGRPGRPRWSLPVIGSVLFTAFAVTVATSAGWFFRAQGLQW